MALLAPYINEKTGESINDAYHRIMISKYDNSEEICIICVLIYYNEDSRNSGKSEKDYFEIIVNGTDFNTYFLDSILQNSNISILNQAYKFLKTIDPDEANSSYSDCPYDYKNDSTDC